MRRIQRGGEPASTSPPAIQRRQLPTPTEEQWEAILALLAEADQTPHRTPLPHRQVVEGLLWMMAHSARWEDIPARFGAGSTLGSRLCRWRKAGIWDTILAILRTPPDQAPAPT